MVGLESRDIAVPGYLDILVNLDILVVVCRAILACLVGLESRDFPGCPDGRGCLDSREKAGTLDLVFPGILENQGGPGCLDSRGFPAGLVSRDTQGCRVGPEHLVIPELPGHRVRREQAVGRGSLDIVVFQDIRVVAFLDTREYLDIQASRDGVESPVILELVRQDIQEFLDGLVFRGSLALVDIRAYLVILV